MKQCISNEIKIFITAKVLKYLITLIYYIYYTQNTIFINMAKKCFQGHVETGKRPIVEEKT